LVELRVRGIKGQKQFDGGRLSHASYWGYEEIVEELLNPKNKDFFNPTATELRDSLDHSVWYGFKKSAHALLKAGADPLGKLENHNSSPFLRHASWHGYQAIVVSLTDAIIEKRRKMDKEKFEIDQEVRESEQEARRMHFGVGFEVVIGDVKKRIEKLKKKLVDLDEERTKFEDAVKAELRECLDHSVWFGYAESVDALLKAGADPKGKHEHHNGESFLWTANWYTWSDPKKYEKIVVSLLNAMHKKKRNMNEEVTKLGLDRQRNEERLKELEDQLEEFEKDLKAEVNQCIGHSVWHGRKDAVEALLQAGADPTKKHGSGTYFIERAKDCDYEEILASLFRAMVKQNKTCPEQCRSIQSLYVERVQKRRAENRMAG
jgi:ankyrin repeat protein